MSFRKANKFSTDGLLLVLVILLHGVTAHGYQGRSPINSSLTPYSPSHCWWRPPLGRRSIPSPPTRRFLSSHLSLSHAPKRNASITFIKRQWRHRDYIYSATARLNFFPTPICDNRAQDGRIISSTRRRNYPPLLQPTGPFRTDVERAGEEQDEEEQEQDFQTSTSQEDICWNRINGQ